MPRTKKLNDTTSFDSGVSRSVFIKEARGSIHGNYEFIEEIGSGAYAKVIEAVHKVSGASRAIKIVKKTAISDESRIHFINEFEILRRTDHPNIVTLYEYYEDDLNFYLVQELCAGGELLDVILGQPVFSEARVARYMKQILSAVLHCHSIGIVHRDLKPENLMLENKDPDSLLKVIDFGISSLKSSKTQSQQVGTMHYTAPEVFRNKYDDKCDVWSCGVILYILLCGKMPFGGLTEEAVKQSIVTGKFKMSGPEWGGISEEAKALVRQMLQVDPARRPTAEQCFRDHWTQRAQDLLRPEAFQTALDNMRNFRAGSRLKRAVLSFIVTQLVTQEERQELNRVFMSLNTAGDGRINTEELRVGCQRVFGISLPPTEIQQILKAVDTDNNGYIDYSEFIMATMNREILLSKERLRSAFVSFDLDGSGRISQAELRGILELSNDQALQELMSEVDVNEDGEIDFKKFKEMMLSCL
jgi:calcium-dependent protein kinase